MRIAALDAHPYRIERTIAALLGAGVALVALGWALAHNLSSSSSQQPS